MQEPLGVGHHPEALERFCFSAPRKIHWQPRNGTPACSRANADPDTLFTRGSPEAGYSLTVYDTNRDFVTVAQLNTGDASVIVLSDSPFKTWQDMVSAAKKNPGKLKFAHSGVWGAVHVPAMHFPRGGHQGDHDSL